MHDSADPKGRISLPTVLFRLSVVLVFIGLAAQLWRLQIIEGRDFRKRAEENHIRDVRLPAPRGVIYDRQILEGRTRILASNAPVFVVSVIPGELPKGRESEVIERLAGTLGTTPATIKQKID